MGEPFSRRELAKRDHFFSPDRTSNPLSGESLGELLETGQLAFDWVRVSVFSGESLGELRNREWG